MKRKQFPAEQIVSVSKQAELGMAVGDIVRQLGISEQTFYCWKKAVWRHAIRGRSCTQDFAGRERTAEEVGGRAEPGQGDPAGRCVKKVGRPALKRAVVAYIIDHYGLKLARACRLIKQVRSTQYLSSRKAPKLALRQRLRELAQVRVHWGYRRLHVLLKREGFQLGVNQTYHWYCLEQLQLRAWRKKRRKSAVARQARIQTRRANDAWSMDFVADQLADGTKKRLLTIIDIYSRESLAIVAGHRLRGEDVVAALNRIIAKRAPPRCLFVDNGSEFSGQMLDLWAYHHQAKIDFSRPGKPTDNCYIETFNGSLRDECLNVHWFASLAEVQAIVEAWRVDYNEIRPHIALNDQTPTAFARSMVSEGLEMGH
jgi:putative transposase